jgi:hypothetical protein
MLNAIRHSWPVTLLAIGGHAQPSDATRLTLERDFTLELEAEWTSLTGTVYGFEKEYDLVRNLAPAEKRASYGRDAFLPLLPAGEVDVGELWSVDPQALLPFLRQFHAGATDRLHHGWFGEVEMAGNTEGAFACLRALGPEHAEVLLRVHADFLLDGDGSREKSSWMTPAQFEGRLVLDRERGVVSSFELALPWHSANVDVNIAEEFGIVADIGRFERMALKGGTPPSEPSPTTREVSLDGARAALARKFYPFAALEWLPLDAALAESARTKRPLHVVLLFGSLLDESC